MKKLLLIGLILVICVLAFPQGVLADEKSAVVNANIAPTVSFTAAATPAGDWVLLTGPATSKDKNITFVVTSNSPWNVNVKSAGTGYMTPTLGGPALASKLQIETKTPGNYQNVDIMTDILNDVAKPSGATYTRGLSQAIALTDARLTTPSGNVYSITLTFECVQDA